MTSVRTCEFGSKDILFYKLMFAVGLAVFGPAAVLLWMVLGPAQDWFWLMIKIELWSIMLRCFELVTECIWGILFLLLIALPLCGVMTAVECLERRWRHA